MSDAGGDDGGGFDGGGEDVEYGEQADFTEVEHESYGERMQSSCCGVCIGFFLFIVSMPLLFWNEGRAVKRQRDLDEGQGLVQQVGKLDINATIDRARDNGLIYVNGVLDGGNSTIFDALFNIDVSNETKAIKYRRDVSVYQWKERTETTTKKDNFGGGQTTTKNYYYNGIWSSTKIDSARFADPKYKNKNPTTWLVDDLTESALNLNVGPYTLGAGLQQEVDWWSSWNTVPLNYSNVPNYTGYNKTVDSSKVMYIVQNPINYVQAGMKDPGMNEIGDHMITFEVVMPDTVSIVAMQGTDGGLKPYITEGGGELVLFKRGTFTSAELFQEAEDENTMMTWVLRFVGFLLMVFGICMILNPIAIAFDVLPFCGDLLEGVIGGCLIPCIALAISIPMSLLVISIAWIFYRPIFAAVAVVMLIIICGCCFFYIKPNLQKKPNANKPPQQQQQQVNPGAPFGQSLSPAQPYGGEKPIEPVPAPAYGGSEPPAFGQALDNPPPPAGGYSSSAPPPASTPGGYAPP